jgi:hypothetical protein
MRRGELANAALLTNPARTSHDPEDYVCVLNEFSSGRLCGAGIGERHVCAAA